MHRNPNCNLCILHETTSNVCIGGHGSYNSKIMIIGEAPGKNEEEGGEPFIGRSGKLLTSILESNNIKRSDCFITNCVQCRPPDNRKPKEEEVIICASDYLLEEYRSILPSMILLLGNTPLEYLTVRKSITKNRGLIKFPDHIFYMDGEAIPDVFATVHPSSALRRPLYREYLEEDIEKFAKMYFLSIP